MADATDSKSVVGNNMWVQVPPPVPVWITIRDLVFFWLSGLTFRQVLTDLGLAQHIATLNEELSNHCTDPDKDETKGLGGYYEAHFFNVERDLDKHDTALTRLERHYQWSIDAARKGDLWDSVRELARALHYLQDIYCPVAYMAI